MESGGYDPSNRFIAPDFKRRQLLFDSFSKLQQKSLNDSSSAASSSTGASSSAPSSNASKLTLVTSSSPASDASSSSSSSAASSLLVVDGGKGTLLYGWGAGYHGQLGLNTARKKCRLQPSCIDFHEPVQMVACGGFHTAVLTDDGRVYTWGDGRLGQLGNLARKHNMHSTPRLVDYLVSYKVTVAYIACGQYHTAAVSNAGRLFTWGSGKWGQLGHGVRQDERFPRKVDMEKALGSAVRVACGDRHTAVLNDQGGLITFGNGQHGQLGHGNGLDCLRPTMLREDTLGGERVVALDCGATTTAAVTEGGALYLWGFGESLHPKGVSNVLETPRQVRMKESVKQVACGLGHVLVLTTAGDVYSFGVAQMGQIGHGTKNSVRNPRLILRGKEIHQIAAGRYHSMAVSSYGVIFSWGCSESGQTGVNLNLENEYLPRILEALLPNVVGHISCGEHHSLAVTSIPHAAVSQDVAHWKLIEDSELALKRGMLRETPNGLKTRHILIIESERRGIIAQLAEALKREAEDKQRSASDKIQLIQSTDGLLHSIARSAARKQQLLHSNQGGAEEKTTSAVVQALQAQGLIPATDAERGHDGDGSSSMSVASIKAIEATALRLATSGLADPGHSAQDNDWQEDDEDEEELQAKRRRAKRLQQLMDVNRSSPASAAASRARSPARSPPNQSPRPHGEKDAEEEKEALVPYDGPQDSRPISGVNHVRFPPVHRPAADVHEAAASVIADPSSSSSSSALSSSAASAGGSGTEVGFAPLAPRIAFIEQTTKTLQRVKSFMSNTVIPAEGNYVQDLIKVKKQYNALKAERERLERQHRAVLHELSLCAPNVEEQQSASVQAEQLKQLNMKLVTLNTRLMEAEENKKNYELYIIRMKEEDLQLGKQIDHLRSICAEYTRLLTKLEKMNRRVGAQRVEVVDETHRFVADVQAFIGFADGVVKDYRRVLNASYKQSCYQEQLFHQRAERQESKRREKVEELKLSMSVLSQQQAEVKEEIDGWEEKVEYYEKRFRKVAAATGLTRAEQIISKFYFNDEITQDLRKEVAAKEAQLAQLQSARALLSQQLSDSKTSLSVSRWKDVSEAEEKAAEAKLQHARQSEDYDKWTHRLTQLVEGMTQLAHKLRSALGTPQQQQQQQQDSGDAQDQAENALDTDLEQQQQGQDEDEQRREEEEEEEEEREEEEEGEDEDATAAASADASDAAPLTVGAPSASAAAESDSDSDVEVLDVTRLMREVAIATAANIRALAAPAQSMDAAAPEALAALSPIRHRTPLPRHPGGRKKASTLGAAAVRSLQERLLSGVTALVDAVQAGKEESRVRAERRARVASAEKDAEQLQARTEQLQQMLLNPRKNIWQGLQERVEEQLVEQTEIERLRDITGSAE